MSDRHILDSLVAAAGELGHGVAVVDLEAQRYVSASPALAQMFGYSHQELVAMSNFFEVVPDEEAEVLQPEVEQWLSGSGERDIYRTRVRHRSGDILQVEIAVKPL